MALPCRRARVSWPYLVEGREFHGSDTVDVFLHFIEEIVPASDQTTLVLVVDHLQFIRLPNLAHLSNNVYFNNTI